MKENKNKFSAFNPADLSGWEVAAREELNGANPWEKLTHSLHALSIQPYYDHKKGAQPKPLLPVSNNKFLGARTWYNCPRIPVLDAKNANQQALECLSRGADGILFDLDDAINVKVLLKGIEWPVCSLNFLAKKNPEKIAKAITPFIKEKKFKGKVFHGALFCSTPRETSSKDLFHTAGFIINTLASPVDEIIEGFRIMTSSLQKNFAASAGQVAFSVTLKTDFFVEVAKLRAMRMVWNKLLGATKTKPTPLFIHAWLPAWIDKRYDPQGNMLKSTTAAMAAILGGCDVLTVESEDNNHPMMSRVALNVSNILREEAYLSKVADPLAGSYFIEDLTLQMADAAWKHIKSHLPR